MKTTLQQGQILDSGFAITAVEELTELNAWGIWARHQKSGAEVFHVLNDDPENLFGFAFATAPEDSTGAAHILEHSVLCGSENYPLKDAFLILAQGSLQTFLNAWTFPDKTVYPASSVNEHDYFNLMSVYADAVFRPLLSEWTFLQEGHRLFLSDAGSNLQISGVVYNEMKGAYSSLDTYAGLWSVKSVLPDTPYAFESGGSPEEIPHLSLEQLKKFHRERYSPANCRIFLAGNISTEKQLAFLDEKFLSQLPAGKPAAALPKASRWTEPRFIKTPCPAGAEQKATVMLSWLCSDSTDSVETLALAALAETLLGHDGSPLTRTLIESGLGEDLSPVTGLEGELRETVFCVGLRGVDLDAHMAEKVEALIMGELQRLAEEGIPPEECEAALLSMEFAHREIRRSHGPYSLVWLRRSLRNWLHGGKPWESLLFMPVFNTLKKNLAEDKKYFEKLIKKYFIDNPHRARVVVEPQKAYLEEKEAALAAELAKTEANLSAADKKSLIEQAAALEKIQGEGDSPEALATIPHLSRQDLSPEPELIPRQLRNVRDIPLLTNDLFTNGITYAHFAFPLDILAPEDYPWLPFFSGSIVSMGLPGMDYGEVSTLLARTVGGFEAGLQTGSVAPGTAPGCTATGRDWLVYRLKTLDEKAEASFDLVRRIITEADFSDKRRVRDLVLELKNDIDSSLAPAGHSYASSRSSSRFSRSRAADEIWNGLEQIRFVHRLANLDTAEICAKLESLRDTLVSQAGLTVNLGGSAAAINNAEKLLDKKNFIAFGPPRPRKVVDGTDPLFALLEKSDGSGSSKAEIYSSPSLQVGFAAITLPASAYGSHEQAAELVLAHYLSTGALWEDIRMKGGAYGAFAHPDNLEKAFSFSTYRDPDPRRSLDAFSSILADISRQKIDEENLVKAIIGTYAKETRPRTAAEKSMGDFLSFLYGIEHEHRRRKLRDIISVTSDELAAAAGRLAASAGTPHPVIIAGKSVAKKAAAGMGSEVRELPV
ncbi:peptidase M16 [Spirochaetia bacterium]|nr:peptidase M16 [Spirochaetia bacterium]